MKMKKWTAGLVAVALVVGAMPALVSPASARETGQRKTKIRDADVNVKGKGKAIKPVVISVLAASTVLAGVIVANSNKRTAPTSP